MTLDFNKTKLYESLDFNQVFYKIVNKNMSNRGFQYKIGLNKLLENFNPSDECDRGGLYFSDLDHIFLWTYLYEDDCWICEVRIPSYAKVYKSKVHPKYKTDYMDVSNPLQISTFIEKNKLELLAVKQNPEMLKYVTKQTPEICIEAVRQNGFAYLYVKTPTTEICLEAVRQNASVFKYMDEQTQTSEICLEAVKKDGCLLQYVKVQSPQDEVRQDQKSTRLSPGAAEFHSLALKPALLREICLQAVKNNGYALLFVNNPTPEIYLEAVKNNGYALQYVNQTPLVGPMALTVKWIQEICLEAVRQNGSALQYVKVQTPEICLTAVRQNPVILRYVKEQTLEICKEALQQDGCTILYVNNPAPELCLIAVRQNGNALQYISKQTPEICLEAVKQNPYAFYYVDDNFVDICLDYIIKS